MKNTVSHKSWLKKYLADPIKAAAYLNCMAEDDDLPFLLKALRSVVEAQGGMGVLAKATKMSRTTLYKTLSPSGNPEVSTLEAILAVYGIRIGFFAIDNADSRRQTSTRPRNVNNHYLTP
jgi:probable addiction module antidote protein